MEIRILGSMEVLDGPQRVELPSGRARSLFALLTLHVGEPVLAGRLIDELWGGCPPATAATVVQGLVSRLRKALEPERKKGTPSPLLETVEAGYRLAIDAHSVDANKFKRLLDEARGKPPDIRFAKLSAALALWRGPALADFVYQPFAQRPIAALEEWKIDAIEEQFDAQLALGRDAELIGGLHEVIATYPMRERLRGLLMVALYRAGRQTEALDVYRTTRALLLEEMGLEPGPALRELEAAILRQDPTLELRCEAEKPLPLRGDAPTWLPRERRTVTVAAVDVVPSAEASLDTEAVAGMAAPAVRVATEVLERHGARVERSLGDELIAFFGFPVAHEDDPLRAVRATLDVRAAVHSLDVGPSTEEDVRHRSRAGVETGDILVAGPGAALRDVVSGTVVSAARRLEYAAADGEVLVGPAAQRLLRGAVILKPAVEADEKSPGARQVAEVVARASAIPRALHAPMVGRQHELTQLRAAFRRAVRSRGVVRTTVIGEAGVGKSRLAKELQASIGDDAYAITLRCAPPDAGMGFFPVRQAVVEAAGLYGWRRLHVLLETAGDGNSAVQQIAAAIALRSPPATVVQLLRPMRRLLETIARGRPLVVVLEDLHWADPAFLTLVDRLESETTGTMLFLCLARPELLDEGYVGKAGDVVRLKPLLGSEIARLAIDRGGPLAQGPLQRIVNLAQGNPLFAEQLLAAVDDGELDVIPASLVGLLTMRLDSLGPGERDVLRCASISGLDVDITAVEALLPNDARPFVERHLAILERKRLLERIGLDRFRFSHALIQMAAYQTMARGDRARLHERFVDYLARERQGPGSALTDIGDYHLRRALEQRQASGVVASTSLARPD